MRVVCLSAQGAELRQIYAAHAVEHIAWPEAGRYGPGVLAMARDACAKVDDPAGIDCVVAENLPMAPVAWQLRELGYTGPILLVPHVNPYPLRNFILVLLWMHIWGPSDVVVAGSPATANRYQTLFGMPARAIPTYGVDESVFYPRAKSAARRELGLSDRPMLLYTGRMAPDKNIGALLAAHRSVRELVPSAELIMAVTFRDEVYVRALAPQLGDVRIEEWAQPDRLAKLYSAADAFLSCATSYYETYGRSPSEATACGAPSILPDWDGFPLCVGADGRLVPVDSLDIPLYDTWSYSMVNLPAVVSAVAELLGSPPPQQCLDPMLSASTTAKALNGLLEEVVATATAGRRWTGVNAVQPGHPTVRQVVDILGAADPERLRQLATCTDDQLPFIDETVRRDLHRAQFE